MMIMAQLYTGVERGQGCSAGATFIDGHHLRFAMVVNGFTEEMQGGCGIPLCRQQEVYCLPCSTDGTVQILRKRRI